jgi:hypothetical protein
VFNFTIPRGDTGETGATGATGAAGPNSVTSATTSDGTANLSVAYLGIVPSGSITLASTNSGGFVQLSGQAATDARSIAFPNASGTVALTASTTGVPDKLTDGTIAGTTTFNSTSYTYGTGAAAAHRTALGVSASGDTVLKSAYTPAHSLLVQQSGTGSPSSLSVGNNTILGRASGGGSNIAALSGSDARTVLGLTTLATTTPAANVATFLATPSSANLAAAVTDETGSGSLVFAESPSLTSPTIGTSATFNATTYTYGAGAAAAHRDALDITSADLQIESLFTLLTRQESDAGVFTANLGTATSSQDGDSLSLSALLANQRPNVYRFRNWNRNPGVSGTANAVIPVRLACAGNIYHLGSGANGASFRCGFGMVNGASAVAADANATTGRGFGWRIAWNSSTSKLEFNLWAHNGTTYVEGTGIDTGLGAGNLDGFFNIILRLASDGTVTAHTWFGSSTSSSSVPSATPSATLAGGPTSGNFANLGTPAWVVATHSTNAPSSGNSIIARISNRKLALG